MTIAVWKASLEKPETWLLLVIIVLLVMVVRLLERADNARIEQEVEREMAARDSSVDGP